MCFAGYRDRWYAMDSPNTVTIGPSKRKITRGLIVASVAIVGGLTLLVLILEYLAGVGLLGLLPVPPRLWARRWAIVGGLSTLFAGYRGAAWLGAVIWNRPRIEIGPDGFVDYGVIGRRSRRWGDIEGEFAVIRVGWPFAVGSQPVVAYHLTDVFKASTTIQPLESLSGYDEAILICIELSAGAGELADLLNRWKQGTPKEAGSF
jgi:hypothetical protein